MSGINEMHAEFEKVTKIGDPMFELSQQLYYSNQLVERVATL